MPKLDGEALVKRLPAVRGRLDANAPLADLTWFRVGGPAEVTVADDNGKARKPTPPQPETVARTMRRLHDGTGLSGNRQAG